MKPGDLPPSCRPAKCRLLPSCLARRYARELFLCSVLQKLGVAATPLAFEPLNLGVRVEVGTSPYSSDTTGTKLGTDAL